MTLATILADTLIGLFVEVVECTDPGKVGLKGKITNETKNLLVIQTEKGEKKVSKDESVFVFKYKSKNVKVIGKLLVSRPEDRIKRAPKLLRRWRFPAFFLKR
ncbi:MAG: ribonuclease P protein subunit [Candidatus Altiarchaeota archaeon]|nr:ribonuclease P protein subunit [Candidatus Altiarchaeota archaeon]